MNDKNKTQAGGENARLYQADQMNITQTGLTFAEAKEIFMLLMNENFIKFSHDAVETAKARVEEIAVAYLEGITARNATLIEQVKEPGMQMALVSAQKEYVKTGDADLADMLVKLLIERTATPQRNLLQISLDESLAVVGKLTTQHIDVITLCFLVKKVKIFGITTLAQLQQGCEQYYKPFVASLATTESSYKHMATAGCGTLEKLPPGMTMEGPSLGDVLLNKYRGLFNKGFDRALLHFVFGSESVLDDAKFKSVLMPCLHDASKLQLTFFNAEDLSKAVETYGFSDAESVMLTELYRRTTMEPFEVEKYISSFGAYMVDLCEAWEKTSLSKLDLSNIGLVIAITACNNKFGSGFDYGIWVVD